jgi:hypothetical protein
MSKPFILGQTVLYKLNEADAGAIKFRREREEPVAGRRGNTASEGQQYPAHVVAVFDRAYANLQVHLDGDDQYWATSRQWGEDPGTCQETSF